MCIDKYSQLDYAIYNYEIMPIKRMHNGRTTKKLQRLSFASIMMEILLWILIFYNNIFLLLVYSMMIKVSDC